MRFLLDRTYQLVSWSMNFTSRGTTVYRRYTGRWRGKEGRRCFLDQVNFPLSARTPIATFSYPLSSFNPTIHSLTTQLFIPHHIHTLSVSDPILALGPRLSILPFIYGEKCDNSLSISSLTNVTRDCVKERIHRSMTLLGTKCS